MTGGSRAPRARAHVPRPIAVVRGVTLAALSALLTAVGHVASGGTLPDLAMLVLLVPMLAVVFVTLAQRSRSTIGTVVTLGLGQVALHELMTLMHPAHGSGGVQPSGLSMLGMHAAVTLVIAVALQHADAAVTAVFAALRRLLPRRLSPPPADRPLNTLVQPGHGVVSRIAMLLSMASARRGPPVGC